MMPLIAALDTVVESSNQKAQLTASNRCEVQILRKMADDLLRLAEAVEQRLDPERRSQ